MARIAKPFRIKIESALGGMTPSTHFGSAGQFRAFLGIDPAQPIDDNDTVYSTIASGLLRPVASEKFSGTTITSAPLFIRTNPKDSSVYVLDAANSAYTVNATLTTVTALSDAGHLSSGRGNGMDYYDNYMYFFKNTDVARYGPLDGAPSFNGTYWTGTLGKTALTDTTYPTSFLNKIQLPNRPHCRHSDGRLYFGDVVSNQGTLHFIGTTKTTVEGDTNNGSTYNILQFGYGLWPTAITSYGTDLVTALFEGSSTGLRQKTAKVAFWDTSASSFDKIIWDNDFPDQIITAMKNINGVLYVASGNYQTRGFRVSQYLGGYSSQEIFYSETGEPPLPGAFDGVLNRILMGSHTNVPESDGCVYSVGLQKKRLSSGLFNVMRSTGGTSSTSVTAVCFADAVEMGFYTPIIGWTQAGDGSTGVSHGLDKQGTSYSAAPSLAWSQLFRLGEDFKIKKISIPLEQAVAANMILTPKVYTDGGAGPTYTLQTINNTNYSGERRVTLRSDSASKDIIGRSNFWLELKWTGSALLTVGLPIIIDGETYED